MGSNNGSDDVAGGAYHSADEGKSNNHSDSGSNNEDETSSSNDLSPLTSNLSCFKISAKKQIASELTADTLDLPDKKCKQVTIHQMKPDLPAAVTAVRTDISTGLSVMAGLLVEFAKSMG
ncbi:hypothetical protein HK100_009562, partial [Physocladia obscura]